VRWSNYLWEIKSKFYNKVRPGFLLSRETEAVVSLLGQISFDSVKRVLDAGSGTGNSMRLLDNYTVLKVELDTSMAMLQKNSESRIRVNGDICSAPFKSHVIDLIVCIGVSEYLPDLYCLLKEFHSLLTDNGHLILTISPPVFFNKMRFLSGHRLFLRDGNQVVNIIKESNFNLIDTKKTTIQIQYLLQKKTS
jgi:SAM-dependent methyltransferase